MSKPHILAIPYPAQGHVIPLMELSQSLVNHGFKVTFVNTDHTQKRVMNALADEPNIRDDQIHLVSIPDGLKPWQHRNEQGQLTEAIYRVMPGKLEELIQNINGEEGDKIPCVLVDFTIGWALEVAAKMNIRSVAFFSWATALLVLKLSVPQLIHQGIINSDGTASKGQIIHFAPNRPIMKIDYMPWLGFSDIATQKIIFELGQRNNKDMELAGRVICNSAYELEPAAFAFAPEILPIGSLLASSRLGETTGNFWQTNSTCLDWLDQQHPCSVIYIAFGSFTVFDQTQFQELALGLELSNRPFLWVVRPDISESTPYPEGYQESGMVGWAPQQKVPSHPSVACFLSHCGWNSTMEGVSNGLPFLFWPYFADQLFNEGYIYDIWEVGLRLGKNKSGIITKEEIKNKVEQLLGDKHYRARASKLKEMAMTDVEEGGQSNKIFKNLIEWIKS